MKNDKDKKPIVRVPLSKLLKRFSNENVIQSMEKKYQTSSPKNIATNLIDDNAFIRKAKINEAKLLKDFSDLPQKGIKSPLIIRTKKSHYEIVLGRRRLLAAKKFNLPSVPCVLIDVGDEEALLLMVADMRDSITRNMVEFSMVCNLLKEKFGYSQNDLAVLTHQSRAQITNIMRLLNLPDSVLIDVSIGKLSFGHAKAIITLPDQLILDLVSRIYKEKLSVHNTEKIIFEYKHGVDYSIEEKRISDAYRCKTNILRKRIILSFESEEDQKKFIKKI
ncbi:MAG: ParB/RepB/Spo0J family partition protein [Bacilli bacterium]|jgi:ParB family chromosome partitioning protein|nr:ParB/RepB/Spo0J family partition protein [Bacilli bacterium]